MAKLPEEAIGRNSKYLEVICNGGIIENNFTVVRSGTTANTTLVISFDNVGTKFLIKNLTADDILVSVGDIFDTDCNILIPSETALVVCVRTDTFAIMPSATDTKGVEIQCLI